MPSTCIYRPSISFMFIAILLASLMIISVSSHNVIPKIISRNTIVVSGDLEIKNQTIIKNHELVIIGNIIVYDGGNLTLINSSAIFRLRYNGEFSIEVKQGGFLKIINSTISSEDKNTRYYIKAYVKSTIVIKNSTIKYAGYTDEHDLTKSGLWIATNKTTIVNSYFIDCYVGIVLDKVTNVTIKYNKFIHCGIIINGFKLIHYKHNIEGNTINGKNLTYIFNETNKVIRITGSALIYNSSNITVLGADIGLVPIGIDVIYSKNIKLERTNIQEGTQYGIRVKASRYIDIKNCTIYTNKYGIMVLDAANVSIRNSTFRDNFYGLFLQKSENISITSTCICYNDFYGLFGININKTQIVNSTFKMNLYALRLTSSSFTRMKQIFFDRNSFYGIFLEYSNQVEIKKGKFYDNSYSIDIRYSQKVNITNCFIAFNKFHGIFIADSENITILNSTLFENLNGIYITESRGINVILNNFIDNFIHVFDNDNNTFDNGKVGNYWSGLNIEDKNGDNIGDSPYAIPTNSVDNYPLVTPVKLESNPPRIIKIIQTPKIITNFDNVIIVVYVEDDSYPSEGILQYFDGLAYHNVSMIFNRSTLSFSATLPKFDPGTYVTYRVFIKDVYNNWCVSNTISFQVIAKDTEPPMIIYVRQIPEEPTELQTVKVEAQITDESELKKVILIFSNGSIINKITMSYSAEKNVYIGEIPSFPAGTKITYRIYVEDVWGNWYLSKEYRYVVKSTLFSERTELDIIRDIIILTVLVAIISTIYWRKDDISRWIKSRILKLILKIHKKEVERSTDELS